MYTIGEVSEMFNLPIPTLRYYDKEGLLNDLERDKSGIRKFNDKTLEALRIIECLKKSGMQIKDIKQFMHWCAMGDKTLNKRKEMFETQKANIEKQMKDLQKVLDMVKYKCWYYSKAVKEGTEKNIKNITLEEMPKDIRKLYENAHNI